MRSRMDIAPAFLRDISFVDACVMQWTVKMTRDTFQTRGHYSVCLVWLTLSCLMTCVTCHLNASSTVPPAAVEVKPLKRHPMLYFTYDDIDALRHKAVTTHRHLVVELRNAVDDITKRSMPPVTEEKFARSWNELYGNNLPPLALYHLLFPDKKLLNLIKVYMDRMASYDRWLVASSPKDEVPLAHHVTGFATALDFVYNDLDSSRQKKYVERVSRLCILTWLSAQSCICWFHVRC